MFRHAHGLGRLSRAALWLTLLLTASPLRAQVEAGAALWLTRMYGTDDSRWRTGAALGAGLQLHELWWLEAGAAFSGERDFETQEAYPAIAAGAQPAEVYRTAQGRSSLSQYGIALRGTAVPVGGKRRHLQYFGRIEGGYIVYRYRLERGETPVGYRISYAADDTWGSVYLTPGAGVEWLYGPVKPFVQIGAVVPLTRPDLPPGTNLGLNTTFSLLAGIKVQLGRRR